MYWLLTHLFRAVPQSYLISCCLGLSPQQVHWIKPLSWLLDSAFFFFFFPSWQETGVWCSEGDMAVTSPGNRHLLYLWKSLPLFSLFISRHVPTSKDQEEEMNEWMNDVPWQLVEGTHRYNLGSKNLSQTQTPQRFGGIFHSSVKNHSLFSQHGKVPSSPRVTTRCWA